MRSAGLVFLGALLFQIALAVGESAQTIHPLSDHAILAAHIATVLLPAAICGLGAFAITRFRSDIRPLFFGLLVGILLALYLAGPMNNWTFFLAYSFMPCCLAAISSVAFVARLRMRQPMTIAIGS